MAIQGYHSRPLIHLNTPWWGKNIQNRDHVIRPSTLPIRVRFPCSEFNLKPLHVPGTTREEDASRIVSWRPLTFFWSSTLPDLEARIFLRWSQEETCCHILALFRPSKCFPQCSQKTGQSLPMVFFGRIVKPWCLQETVLGQTLWTCSYKHIQTV